MDIACPFNMVRVNEGSFQRGTSPEMVSYIMKLCEATFVNCYSEWFSAESPQHSENVSTFCIDKYEFPNIPGRVPLHGVTWQIANDKCHAAGKRLCMESEWEKACAGPSGRFWPFGNKHPENVCNSNTKALTPSGTKEKCYSQYGAYDMSGNAAEWTSSTLTKAFAPAIEIKEPRIMKGGSYRDHFLFSRCAYRDSYTPDSTYDEFGFRCCWPVTGTQK